MELNFTFMADTFLLALTGIPTTLFITAVALTVGLPLGFLMALSILYKTRFFRQLSTFYISFMRGIPVLLQILLVYSLLPSLFNSVVKKLNLGINVFDTNPIIYACVVFTLNATAELSELCRSALMTVDHGQMEAALATGLTRVQAYRRIILPQALVAALPNLCNVTIHLIKNTSLAFLMTVKDITAIAKVQAAYGYNYVEAYLDILLIYILVCSVVQTLYIIAEKRFGQYKSLKRAV